MALSDECVSLVNRACSEGWAVAQLNTNGATYGMTRAIVDTAEEERAPVILGAYAANAQYRGLPYCAQHLRFMADSVGVPVKQEP